MSCLHIYQSTHIITNIFKIAIFDSTAHVSHFHHAAFANDTYYLFSPCLITYDVSVLHQYLDIDHHDPEYTTCRHGAADLNIYRQFS